MVAVVHQHIRQRVWITVLPPADGYPPNILNSLAELDRLLQSVGGNQGEESLQPHPQ